MNQLDDLYEPNWENTANKLMEYHVEALFVHDQHSRLLTINENLGPTVPAPAFFLGRTIDGKAVCRFRYDVADKTAMRLQELSLEEPSISEFPAKPKYFAEYMALLHGQQYTMGRAILSLEKSLPHCKSKASRVKMLLTGCHVILSG